MEAFRKHLLYQGLCETSDRKTVPTNDGHLGYTDTSMFNTMIIMIKPMNDNKVYWMLHVTVFITTVEFKHGYYTMQKLGLVI